MQEASLSDEQVLERLYKVMFVMQHNPNCPSPFLIRLCPVNGAGIDMKSYGDPIFGCPSPGNETKDILGFGKTITDAAREAFEIYDQAYLEFSFNLTARTWERSARYASDSHTDHEAYQRIVAMGSPVIPLVLRRVKQRPSWLVHALYDITGENPCPPEHAGRLKEQIEDWIKWGIQKGYLQAGA